MKGRFSMMANIHTVPHLGPVTLVMQAAKLLLMLVLKGGHEELDG